MAPLSASLNKNKIRLWNRVLVAILALAGLCLTAAASWLIYANAYQLWQLASIAEAERLSSELQYRVLRNREPLIAASSLYSGSTDVTQDELQSARNQILETTGLDVAHSLAFVVASDEAEGPTYIAVQSVGELDLLPPVAGHTLNPLLAAAIESARSENREISIAALLRRNDTSYLPISIASSNGALPGTLVYLMDFSQLLANVIQDVLTSGTTLRITHPADETQNHADLPDLPSAPEASHTIDIDMGMYSWQLQWQFDADYADGIDDRLVYVVAIGGSLITLLICFIILTLLQQRQTVREQIQRKTDALQSVQRHLVQQEKMAALGKLVAGISHELNTPIGNTLLAATLLNDRSRELGETWRNSTADSELLDDYVSLAVESSRLIEKNAMRATELIRSFKQVAVDQSSERRRQFRLAETTNELMQTLKPSLKAHHHRMLVLVPEDIVLDSYPGALYQVISNLVSNSITHAFPESAAGDDNAPTPRGTIRLEVTNVGKEHILIEFSDDGAGIPVEIRDRIFDPFFTTRMGSGGSGLGLHIVYTLVSGILGGQISLDNTSSGTLFRIRLPLQAPLKQ